MKLEAPLPKLFEDQNQNKDAQKLYLYLIISERLPDILIYKITLFLLFVSISVNYKSGKLYENIKIWPDLIEIKRVEANGSSREWCSNPYWTKVNLYEESQKIENFRLFQNDPKTHFWAYLGRET